ncbi:GAD-like domain-containing protein [Stenotrophomonas sp. B1-1]|uniref:GAD-like domain-containing protein n=1 Tax=Stenotrophomonas sp. B1-1 TaxID=2710648 RepID=UPI0013D99E3C|nr:GAD-like domain-containing protein [Stenotrophomonas sp. B1-1]
MEDDQDFALFIENFGEATARDPVPEASLRRWAGILPDSLLRYWRRDGWANYGNGRLWTVNPEDYEDLMHAWLEETPFSQIDSYHVFARSGFGRLYLCGEASGVGVSIDPIRGEVFALQNRLRLKSLAQQEGGIKAFFACAEPDDFDLLDADEALLFARAMSTCGPLQADEMYGFEPAQVCGGEVALGNLRRLKLHPHLHMLRQFAAPAFPRYAVDPKPLARK